MPYPDFMDMVSYYSEPEEYLTHDGGGVDVEQHKEDLKERIEALRSKKEE